MKREQCLKNAIARMEELTIQRNIIAKIPLNIPVMIFYRCPIRNGWNWEVIRLVSEAFNFNYLSIRATMIAVEDAGAYPFDRDIERRAYNRAIKSVYALSFKRIEKWEPFNRTDLPLLLGWPNQYPRLAEILKEGPPKRSLAELGAQGPVDRSRL
jgi:hypothetical protein